MKELGSVVTATKAFLVGSIDQELQTPFKCQTAVGTYSRPE